MAEVFAIERGGRSFALKVARATPAGEGSPVSAPHTRALRLLTGLVVEEPVDCGEILRAEGKYLRAVGSPAVVRCLDEEELRDGDEVRHALLLERLEGPTLWQAVRSKRSPGLAAVVEVVNCLLDLREKTGEPWHGDITASNVLLDESIRLIDPAASGWLRDEDDVLDLLLATPECDPWLSGSEVAGVGSLIATVTTGAHLLHRASPDRPRRALSDELRAKLQRASRNSRGGWTVNIPYIPLPSEVAPAMPQEVEALCLACLGLARNSEQLTTTAEPSLEKVLSVLRPFV